jgi:hypothetical protein
MALKSVLIGRAGIRLSKIPGTSLHGYNTGIKVGIVVIGDTTLNILWYVQL